MPQPSAIALPIHFSNSRIAPTPAMVAHVHRRVSHLLGRFAHRIVGIDVHVDDVNGPKGGEDKVCTMHVHLAHAPMVMVKHAAADYYGAVSAAAHRLKTAIARTLHKRR